MSLVASYSSDIWLNLAQVPVSQAVEVQDHLSGPASACVTSVLPQTNSDMSVSQLPGEPHSPQTFCELRTQYLVFSGSCHITEHADILHLPAFSFLPLPFQLPPSLDSSGNSASLSLMWSNLAVLQKLLLAFPIPSSFSVSFLEAEGAL